MISIFMSYGGHLDCKIILDSFYHPQNTIEIADENMRHAPTVNKVATGQQKAPWCYRKEQRSVSWRVFFFS